MGLYACHVPPPIYLLLGPRSHALLSRSLVGLRCGCVPVGGHQPPAHAETVHCVDGPFVYMCNVNDGQSRFSCVAMLGGLRIEGGHVYIVVRFASGGRCRERRPSASRRVLVQAPQQDRRAAWIVHVSHQQAVAPLRDSVHLRMCESATTRPLLLKPRHSCMYPATC